MAELVAFTRVSGVITTPVDVDGTTANLVVDTGDPFLLLNPTEFPSAPAVGTESSVEVGSTTQSNIQVITSSASPTSPDPSVPVGGLLGCTVICGGLASFDYRAATFTLGSVAAPAGLEAATTLGFTFDGGGTSSSDGMTVTEPRSRIVVTVDIEGAPHTLILDTGASIVTVNAAAYAAITADGRAQLMGGSISTTMGMSTGAYTRVASVAVGGVDVDSVVVAHDSSFDMNLADVTADAGVTIEGSLGGTFLQNFYVTIDYPNHQIHLARYADTSFLVDPAENIGIGLGATSGNGVLVTGVFPGTDAATKGVREGDTVVAIDGQTLAGLSVSQLGVLVSGKVGSTKSVQLGAAQTLANQTVSLRVAELLPLP
jgi:Aspartyl protease/PDZ domain